MGYSPMSLGLGIVGYSGSNTTQFGPSLSLIFNRAFGVNPLFMQFGIDVVNPAKLQAQVGYKIY